jgi:hypothetical protein
VVGVATLGTRLSGLVKRWPNDRFPSEAVIDEAAERS